jgi:hypothetical protein
MKPGTKIAGRYVIEGELGRGGMGAVYLALDTKFRERIALKVGAPSGGTHRDFRERFEREARIGNKLGRVSGVVRAFDWGPVEEGGDRLYLAMDLVEGAKPLDLVTGPLETRLARLRTAARLVSLVHEKGVIHRDLKPANFLQAGDGTLFISDFGLAKFKGEHESKGPRDEDLTQTGASMGTPRYMPPEQFEDSSQVDERADVYALGVMLYSALVGGKVPYEGSTANIVMAQDGVRRKRIRAPRPSLVTAEVPAELDALCARAIEVDRDERLPSAEALTAGLDSYLEGPDRRTVRTDTAKATAAPAATSWALAPVGCLLALVGIAGMVLAFVIMRAPPPAPMADPLPPPAPAPVVPLTPTVPVEAPPPPPPPPVPSSPPPAPIPEVRPDPASPPPAPGVPAATRDDVVATWQEFLKARKDAHRGPQASRLLEELERRAARWPQAPGWVLVALKLLELDKKEAWTRTCALRDTDHDIAYAFYLLGTRSDARQRSNARGMALGHRSSIAEADRPLFDGLLEAVSEEARVR